jgi:hypothetical protein
MDRGCGKAQPQQAGKSGTLRLVLWTQPRSVTMMKRCSSVLHVSTSESFCHGLAFSAQETDARIVYPSILAR